MEQGKKKSWFRRHKILTGIIAFFILIIVIALISEPYISSGCKSFVEEQIPDSILFYSVPAYGSEILETKDTWNDGTKIETNLNEFRRGSNEGENINQMYLNQEDVYFKYEISNRADEEGNILEDKIFKILVKDYYAEPSEKGTNFYLKDYEISECNILD